MTPASKIRRPLLAALLIGGLAAGAASAYDFCSPCAPAPIVKPVSSCSSPCGVQPIAVPVAQSAPIVTACAPAACPSPAYGGYSDGYYSSAPIGTGGTSYLVPTLGGLVESASPDLPYTNEVGNYYATHDVIDNQVREVSSHYAGRW